MTIGQPDHRLRNQEMRVPKRKPYVLYGMIVALVVFAAILAGFIIEAQP